jgi:hypothetical protein
MAADAEIIEMLRANGHLDMRAAGLVKADAPVEPLDVSSFLKLGKALNSGGRSASALAMDNIMAQFGQKTGLTVADLASRASSGDEVALGDLTQLVEKTGQMSGAMTYKPEPDTGAALSAGLRHAVSPFVPDSIIDSRKAAVDAASYKQTNPWAVNTAEIGTNIAAQAALEYAMLRGGRAAGIRPTSNTLGSLGGTLGGGVPLAGNLPIAAAAGAGAVTGGLKSYDEGGSALKGAAVGGGLGFLGGAVSGVATFLPGPSGMKAPSRQPPNIRQLTEEMHQKGYWVNPGLVSGNTKEQMLDNAVRTNPKTAGAFDDLMANNQSRFNIEVANELGITSPTGKLDVESLHGARDTSGQRVHEINDSVRPAPYTLDQTIPAQLRAGYLAATGRRQLPPGANQHADLWRSLDTGGRVVPNWADQATAARSVLTDARDRALAANRMPLADYYEGLITAIPTPRGLTPELLVERAAATERNRIATRLLRDRTVQASDDVPPGAFLRIAPESEAARAARFLQNQQKSFRGSFIMTNAVSKDLGRTTDIIPKVGIVHNLLNAGRAITAPFWYQSYLTGGMNNLYNASARERAILGGGLLGPAILDRND